MKRNNPEKDGLVGWRGLITSKPNIYHGQACVRGTRIAVSVILSCFAAGMTEQEILEEYPTLTLEGIRAAAAYGAALTGEQLLPWPKG